ncbi:MAG: Nascent polypeptide-associated complex protein [Candidatus Altiarchaeota archaeon]|nr:Nascent polypeptide-associated complex protein [Candidatus Altiarchaeota archaeon]
MDMRALAKQLKTKQHSPKQVIFQFDNESWIFEAPQVVEANMMGNIVFQVIGKYERSSGISEEDVTLIMEKTNCSKEQAQKTLKETGDVAEAIIQLSE